tara:strand:- start:2765 stop:3073 length:309 start_codon:yes stop_codon:yes gene_type:complete
MKLLYTHENRVMVLNVKNVLTSHDFDVTLNNEFASSASGGLAPFDTWPELWLLNDNDFDEAKQVVESINNEINSTPWECHNCKEKNDQSFDYCWNCHADHIQ